MLTLITGLPNAGKTTYSLRFPDVIHLDDFPQVGDGGKYDRRNRQAASRETAVVEGVYNTRKLREQLLKVCAGHDKKVCVWIDTPADVCKQRENRGRPAAIVDVQAAMLEPPAMDEGWDEIIIVEDNHA